MSQVEERKGKASGWTEKQGERGRWPEDVCSCRVRGQGSQAQKAGGQGVRADWAGGPQHPTVIPPADDRESSPFSHMPSTCHVH